MVPQTISQNIISSTSVDGIKVFFRPLVLGDLQVVFTEYEKHILEVFKPRRGDIVIDVGAYIGYPLYIEVSKTSLVTTACARIDSILEQYSISKVDWIKIDAESAEMLILRGAKGLLSSKNLDIVLETYPPNREEVIRYLLSYNFKIKPLSAYELLAYK
jgi:hypothetical protein